MILTLLLAALACLALLPIVLPLLRGVSPPAEGVAFDQAVYRDQLRELDRDVARGLMTEAETQASRVEIQRRLLAAASRSGADATVLRPSPVLALAVIAIASVGSIALYTSLGVPIRLPDAAGEQRVEVERLADQLRARLAREPDSQEGWRLYGRTMAALASWQEAIEAYQRAIGLGDASADTAAALGEVLVARAGGAVSPAARVAFADALGKDPDHPLARYYMALAAGQDGRPLDGIAALRGLASELPAESPARAELVRQVAALAQQAGITPPELPAHAAGPDEAAMEAASNLPAADRQRMIRDMVARLAERLETNPGDLDGWMRLGRSYGVLGDNEKSAEAYERAAALRPDDITIALRAVEALLTGLSITDALPPRAVAILRRIEVSRPNEPAVLWYLGMVAAREGQKSTALAYWNRLRGSLPADHPDAAMVRSAIEALEGTGPRP